MIIVESEAYDGKQQRERQSQRRVKGNKAPIAAGLRVFGSIGSVSEFELSDD